MVLQYWASLCRVALPALKVALEGDIPIVIPHFGCGATARPLNGLQSDCMQCVAKTLGRLATLTVDIAALCFVMCEVCAMLPICVDTGKGRSNGSQVMSVRRRQPPIMGI